MKKPEISDIIMKIVLLASCVFLAMVAVEEIKSGRVLAGRSHPDVFYAAQQPVLFWVFVALKFVASVGCLYYAFKRKRDKV
jgi:hypothetical protein